MLLATWRDLVAASPPAFLIGLLVGFVLANRYRISRRNGGKETP